MTLATVERYDPDRTGDVGTRAVVLGGSVAGLLATRVLADVFDEVVVVEKDPLPEEVAARRGVPQGRHVHVLETAGRKTFEDLFPGYGEDLISAGGLILDMVSDFNHYERGGYLADGPDRMPVYFATRPLIEGVLLERIEDLENVTVRSECLFSDYRYDDEEGAVSGVVVRNSGERRERLDAELVVDATGRTSSTPDWLDDHGFDSPASEEVSIDVAYSTTFVERPATDRRAFFVVPNPSNSRGLGMLPVEDGRWQVTLMGVHGTHPPADEAGFRSFARELPVEEPVRLLEDRPWCAGEVEHYPFPSNLRRRYEDLGAFPDGLVVLGDALASFNPIYGQGMSVAALEAVQLHHELAEGGVGNLGPRFFERVAPVVDSPWSIAVAGDFEFPGTSGPKPRGTDLLNRYFDRLVRTAQSDGAVRQSLFEVFMLEKPPRTLFEPGVLYRVLAPT